MELKIPFNISNRPLIEKGIYKVVTREGAPVRIISWDADLKRDNKMCCPIVALVKDDTTEHEVLITYAENGTYYNAPRFDLFIKVNADEILTPFEKQLLVSLQELQGVVDITERIPALQMNASILLNLAKEQLRPEIDAKIAEAYKNQDEVVYQQGYDKGKAETLDKLISQIVFE